MAKTAEHRRTWRSKLAATAKNGSCVCLLDCAVFASFLSFLKSKKIRPLHSFDSKLTKSSVASFWLGFCSPLVPLHWRRYFDGPLSWCHTAVDTTSLPLACMCACHVSLPHRGGGGGEGAKRSHFCTLDKTVTVVQKYLPFVLATRHVPKVYFTSCVVFLGIAPHMTSANS